MSNTDCKGYLVWQHRRQTTVTRHRYFTIWEWECLFLKIWIELMDAKIILKKINSYRDSTLKWDNWGCWGRLSGNHTRGNIASFHQDTGRSSRYKGGQDAASISTVHVSGNTEKNHKKKTATLGTFDLNRNNGKNKKRLRQPCRHWFVFCEDQQHIGHWVLLRLYHMFPLCCSASLTGEWLQRMPYNHNILGLIPALGPLFHVITLSFSTISAPSVK